MKHNKFINKENFEEENKLNNEVEPHSDYSDHIYVEKGKSVEDLYDRNNPAVRLILLIVGGIAFIGTLYYVLVALDVLK